MELKNAVAVCLISLCSATLVVLIARSLDSQAALQLEPRLERIANELEAIRRSGGTMVAPHGAAVHETIDDGLIVYYFHGERCATCRSIESQAHKVVQSDFASQLDSGKVVWKVIDYLKPSGKELQELFKVSDPVVVLVRMKAGQIDAWNRLDRVWGLKDDPPAFAGYVRDEIQAMLDREKESANKPSSDNGVDIPVPTVPSNIPIP